MDNMNTGLKHKHIVEQMTLSEKCGLLSGRNMWSTKPVERLGIRSLFLADGPTGVRKQIDEGDHLGMNESLPATCWPTASALACSWDPELCEKVGGLLGKEAVSQGVDVVLGPGLNIKRSPICGRNFEYFSEDPYLSGKLAAGFIRGIQGNGIAACAKHFAANSQELNRMNCDSVVDERTLREIYLTNFEIAVKEGRPKAIMTSYNKVNGAYANENEHLLRDILAGEWGFTGVVMSDWGGSNDHVEGVRAGSHLEMPGTYGDSERQLEQAVREGRISEELIDQRVDELLDLVFSLRMPGCDRIPGNNQLPENDQRSGHIHHPAKDSHSRPDRFSGDHMITTFDIDYHHEMAEKAAEQTIVLLKNESRILPLKKGARVTFTMIHNWTPAMGIRPRTGVFIEDNGLLLNNYVIMKPVDSLQQNPSAYCNGENATARFNSILIAPPGSNMDIGSRVFLNGKGSRTEMIARTITTGGEIISRGYMEGNAPDVKGHLECRGLILGDAGSIHAIPELKGTLAGIDLSHEAAVGKIAEEEVEYLMARGLTRDEATAAIVRGFLNVDIEGLPPLLNAELQKAIKDSEDDMF